MGVLDDLAQFVSAAKASDLPADDRAILRRHVSDVVAARVAGAACSEGQTVSSLYPQGEGADSIAGLATLVRLTETDDIHTPSGVTPSSAVVPVALALAATNACAPDRLESAIFVGVETIVRLGMATGGAAVLYQGIWPTRAGATLGAAAAASRVLALPAAATKNALSLAVMLTAGRTGRFQGEPSGRWVLFATAVGAGVRAALAARSGFAGDHSVLDSDWLERSLGVPIDGVALMRDLGRGSVFPQLSLKPYCTSRQALPGAEAMRALVAEGLDPRAITSFKISVPAAYAAMISQKLDPAVRASSYVSGAGLAAIAALDPCALYDVERVDVLRNPEIIELAAKGEIAADPELDAHYPARWPAKIEVRTVSGTLRREVIEPIGSPGRPLGDRELDEKLARVLARSERSDAVDELLAVTRSPFASEASATALARFFVRG